LIAESPKLGPPSVHILAKPTGAICNLECAYCFYLGKELLYPGSRFQMDDQLLELYIKQLIESHHTNQVTVAWQGGEPTLMGIPFFQRAIEFEEKYRRPGMTFENTIQTNGTLLSDQWCEFLKRNNFLVGISIDGPRELHDAFRVDRIGKPTFDKVMRGLRLLQKHGVDYNILTTVNRVNGDHPLEVYRFLRDDARTSWIQFIPVVERINSDGSTLYQEGSTVSERSVGPEQFGRFLIAIFNEWVHRDVGRIFVQTFEAAVRNWMGLPTSGMCVFDQTCGRGLALEHNGDLYSCDHFVEPKYKLGNIRESQMHQLVSSDRQLKFGLDKFETLPRYCMECEVRFACNGECPKNRFILTPDGEPGLNYLCAGYKAFFSHADHAMKVLAALIRNGQPAADIRRILATEDAAFTAAKVGRNELCPCGSGRKAKKCHGSPTRLRTKQSVAV